MPPTREPENAKSLPDVVNELGVYPLEAFHFVEQGLAFAVRQIHGEKPDPNTSRHITGQQLCEGLRLYATSRWGYLAGTVLRRWNITSTYDFGRIVFAMVENGFLQKTDEDSIEDFRNVFDFRTAFEARYVIEPKL